MRVVVKLVTHKVFIPVNIDKPFQSKLKLGAQEEIFLKAFTFQTFSNVCIDLPKKKNKISEGLLSAQKFIISAKDNIDMSLFKQCKAKNPSTAIFGDVYGKEYPVEKKILDKMIHLLRTQAYEIKLHNYLIPKGEIIKNKGLAVTVTSDLLTESEKAAANCLKNQVGEFEFPNPDDLISFVHCEEFQKNISSFQKKLKALKTGIDTIVSERVTACFAPYKGAARTRAKKENILTLIANAKEDKETYTSFNPSMIFLLAGRSRGISFIHSEVSKEEFEKICRNFYDEVTSIFSEDIAKVCEQEYRAFLLTNS